MAQCHHHDSLCKHSLPHYGSRTSKHHHDLESMQSQSQRCYFCPTFPLLCELFLDVSRQDVLVLCLLLSTPMVFVCAMVLFQRFQVHEATVGDAICRCQMYGDMQALFLHPPIDHQAKSSLPPPTLMNELYRDHSSIVDRVLGTLAKKTRLPDGTHDREQVRPQIIQSTADTHTVTC